MSMTIQDAKEIFQALGAEVHMYNRLNDTYVAQVPEVRMDELCEGIMQIYFREPPVGEAQDRVLVWSDHVDAAALYGDGTYQYDAVSLIRLYRECRHHNHDCIARAGLNFGNPLNV